METIDCRRHPGTPGPALARPPFRSALGDRIQREICADCWRDWLQHQTLLINHYGLDPRKAEAREFLYGQVKAVLFDEGEAAEIDTSKQGTIGPPGG
ncbi:MAG: Fe(2+)-trafficking protein [Gemmatimonadota bacterium]|nr:Fe(2+)-trafficking protein [Gemmatimonadota bacterium]